LKKEKAMVILTFDSNKKEFDINGKLGFQDSRSKRAGKGIE
jgi:hypothetical protein